MKKVLKISTILIAIFLSLSILFFTIFAFMGVNFIKDSKDRIVEFGKEVMNEIKGETADFPIMEGGELYEFSNVKNLTIDMEVGYIKITQEKGRKDIQVSISPDIDRSRVHSYMDGNELVIKTPTSSWKDYILKDWKKDNWIEITLPENYRFDEVEIALATGEIDADALYSREMNLQVGMGSVAIQKSRVKDLEIDCNLGSVSFTGKVDEDIKTSVDFGAVTLELDGEELDYSYKIKPSLGSIEVNGIGYQKETIVHDGKGFMNLECNLGRIAVLFQ